MDFNDIMKALPPLPEHFEPASIYDDLSAAYNNLSERSDAADSKVAALEETISSLNNEITALKTKNYDLLTQIDAAAPVESEAGSDGDPSDEDVTVDDLFDDNFDEDDE